MSDDFELALQQISSLAERRQNTTAIYISVNTALAGAMAFLFKDGQLTSIIAQISVLTLLFSGIMACSLWRRIITQYSTLMDWWYEQLRLLENNNHNSKKLITKEYESLYQKKRKPAIGLTVYESRLTWLFTIIYGIFGLVLLGILLFHLR